MGRRPNPNGRQRPLVTRVYPGQQSFSIAQAAALTGRHPSTIHRLIETGAIHSAETPLGHRLTRAEIERLIGGPLDDERLGSLLQQILA
jgi:Helix-turn-helix domain